ncbi:LRR receptor-like serine/threonine-protein kinase [Pyrus ussuriensis x Pyrus communis]|uniref:LRR receptor-like serine/threonine-protein kinase n=1 Tax=Pyrus ussuriensis x Pyrus communis TaxID=2448454 RepID=A0A5N5I2F4_9ROSA|nr:LRR receptor-like serine/threonine-protein kinase [Pyrus ussuriensis x Pyrus communis]
MEDIGSFEPNELETIVGMITMHEEDRAKNIASLKQKLKRACRPMLAAKEIEKFMSSAMYNHALAEQYKQGFQSRLSTGFEIFRRYAMKVDVNGKWTSS